MPAPGPGPYLLSEDGYVYNSKDYCCMASPKRLSIQRSADPPQLDVSALHNRIGAPQWCSPMCRACSRNRELKIHAFLLIINHGMSRSGTPDEACCAKSGTMSRFRIFTRRPISILAKVYTPSFRRSQYLHARGWHYIALSAHILAPWPWQSRRHATRPLSCSRAVRPELSFLTAHGRSRSPSSAGRGRSPYRLPRVSS
jgi:hypothetical protein